MDLSDISITSWVFRGTLAVLAVLAIAMAAFSRGSAVRRLVFGGLGVVLVVAFIAAAINAHFAYYPTVGNLFGQTSADEANVDDLTRTDVPDHGEVVQVSIPPTKSGFQGRPAQVFVPPAWFGTPKPKLPVIMLFSGSPGTPEDWTRGGFADQTADQFAAQNKGVAPILVMPDINGSLTADTECVSGPRGDVDTYLADDVRNYIIQRFDTATEAKSWALAGLSEGGMCATLLALRHPDLFLTFANYGGLAGPRSGETNAVGTTVNDYFGGSQTAFEAHEPQNILQGRRFPGMGAWFESGASDGEPVAAARLLAPLARQAGIQTCVVLIPAGGHTFLVWTQALKDSLPWMAARMGLIPESPAQTSLCQPVG